MFVHRRPSLLAATLVAGLLLGGCATLADPAPGADGDGPADVAAVVSGTEISREEVEEGRDEQLGVLDDVPEEERDEARLQLERDVLSARIQLLAVEAATEEAFGLDVDEARVDELLEESIESAGGEEAFDALAAEQGLTPETARKFAREGAYVQALVEYINENLLAEAGIDDARLLEEYEATIDAYQSSDARHILVETEAEADAVLARLEAGEDFGAIAEELSLDPGSGANGGSLGVAPRGSYVPEFEEAIYAATTVPGDVLGPIETQFGFHLIIVDEIVTQPFEEVRSDIEQGLGSTGFTDFLNAAFDEIDVEVDPYYGEWDVTSRQVVGPQPEGSPSEGDAEGDAQDQDSATEPTDDASDS